MKVLLDECLPKALKQEFRKYNVSTVPEMGWAGRTNGELFRLAKGRFDVFITVDQNLQYQQYLKQLQMSVVLIAVKNNRFETLRPLISKVHQALATIQDGQLVRVS